MFGFQVVQNAWSLGQDPYRPLHELAVAMNTIEKNYIEQSNIETMVHNGIHGMVGGLDSHSKYLGPKEFSKLKGAADGWRVGIGIEINMDRSKQQHSSTLDLSHT